MWRDSLTLQFGPDAVAEVRDPAPWQQRLASMLVVGIPDGALEACAQTIGAAPGEATRFAEAIAPALAPAPLPLIDLCAELTPGLASSDTDALLAGLASSAGIRMRVSQHDDACGDDPDEIVVLVAHDVVHPRRATTLMRADRAHVPVVFTGAAVRVGPYVVPGRTPCLACVEAHRRDAEPTWPVVAAQLVGRTLPAGDPALAMEAGIAVARLVRAGLAADASAASVTLFADSLQRRRAVHVPHPRCLCRSLEETATPSAAPTPLTRSRPTTTARAFARPA